MDPSFKEWLSLTTEAKKTKKRKKKKKDTYPHLRYFYPYFGFPRGYRDTSSQQEIPVDSPTDGIPVNGDFGDGGFGDGGFGDGGFGDGGGGDGGGGDGGGGGGE